MQKDWYILKVKKILFINDESIYPYSCTGASESIHLLLQQLKKIGGICMAIGCMQNYYLRHNKFDQIKESFIKYSEPYICKNYASYNLYFNNIQNDIKNFDPDLIITQIPSSTRILETANLYEIPIVLFIHSFDEKFTNKQLIKHITTYSKGYYKIFAVSEDVRKCVSRYGAESLVLYPGFQFEDYNFRIEDAHKILFVNPCLQKGVYYIMNLAKEFHEESFVIRENWGVTEKRIRDNLLKFDNISILPYTTKKYELFENIKLLLVPSICKEAFGRLIIEALYLGINVIANDIGGISEALSYGDLIKYPYELESWKCCLKNRLYRGNIVCDNKGTLKKKFDISVIVKEFLEKSNLTLDAM